MGWFPKTFVTIIEEVVQGGEQATGTSQIRWVVVYMYACIQVLGGFTSRLSVQSTYTH